jgi:hypothetical protein
MLTALNGEDLALCWAAFICLPKVAAKKANQQFYVPL